MFLQPFILFWGLPLILLPVAIHFLNRLRYRNVAWAAMMFLLAATRSSTKHARIKQWIILAMRVLAVLAVVIALARPHMGGWLGLAFGGPPDTVMILLDRSASMGATDPRSHESLREQATSLVAAAAKDLGERSTFVLIDSLTLQPQVLPDVGQLSKLPYVSSTDAGADLPAMLATATNYLLENPAARPEIWIASDLQASSWRPEDSQWQGLSAQLAALPQKPRIRLLAVQGADSENLSISLVQANRRRRRGQEELALTLIIRNPAQTERQVPLQLLLDGRPRQIDVTVSGPELVVQEVLPLAGSDAAGWGMVSLPADANANDNAVFFGYAPPTPMRTLVVADDAQLGRLLALCAAPAPDAMNQQAQVVSAVSFGEADLSTVSMVIWQSALPKPDTASLLSSFVDSGGSLLLLPHTGAVTDARFADDIGWGESADAPADSPFTVSHWEEDVGPLATTAAGERLPLERVRVKQRRGIVMPEGDVLATCADGTPLVMRRRIGGGQLVVLGSLPLPAWSNLHEGSMIVPMIQRLLDSGGLRLSGIVFADAGNPPSQRTSGWEALDITQDRDPRRESGAFRTESGSLVALNRPLSEDAIGAIEPDTAESLFTGLSVSLTLDRSGGREALQGEVTTAFLTILLLALLAEAVLTSPGAFGRGAKQEEASHV